MTNYKITFTGDNLYTRHETSPAVFSRAAVEFKPATYEGGKLFSLAVEAQEAVEFKAAEYRYTPYHVEFEYENTDGLESGAEVFKAWLEGEDNTDSLSDMLNIRVEKESSSYHVSYTKRFEADITAEQADEFELGDAYEVEVWLDGNGDSGIDYPDDTGELADINVDVNSSDHVDVDWN
jgi:hypothetical protein|tara:strand:+ start:250 stop:786 length:537 start_codon:yes stop_codon:yes gene_type:complete